MTVTELIVVNLMLAYKLLVKSYTALHNNHTNTLVADTILAAETDGRAGGARLRVKLFFFLKERLVKSFEQNTHHQFCYRIY